MGDGLQEAHGKAKSADFAAAEEWVANRYTHERIFFEFCITIRAIEMQCPFDPKKKEKIVIIHY